MRVSKENDSGDRRPWPTKRHTLGSYSARASANPRSHVGSGSAEPPFAASWPKRNPDSSGLTQPCRKKTNRLQPLKNRDLVLRALRIRQPVLQLERVLKNL